MVRNCKSCEYKGPKETFPEAGRLKGVQYYRHICLDCYHKQKLSRRHRIRAFLDYVKQEVECVRCGNNDWRVIEWHHSNPEEKEFILGNAVNLGISIERIQKELEKCTPLCANCHRIVEYEIKHNNI